MHKLTPQQKLENLKEVRMFKAKKLKNLQREIMDLDKKIQLKEAQKSSRSTESQREFSDKDLTSSFARK